MSTLVVTTVSPSSGSNNTYTTSLIPKHLLLYDQTGPTITDSTNVSSIDDDGAGNLGVNFTNAYDATDYKIGGTGGRSATTPLILGSDSQAAGAVEMTSITDAAAATDATLGSTFGIGDIA